MPGAEKSLVGPCPRTCVQLWCWTLCRWPFASVVPGVSFIILTRAVSTPPWPSASAVGLPECDLRWVPSEIAMTTLCVKASSPLWNVSCSIATLSTPQRRHAWLFLSSSKAGTIRIDGIQPWIIFHQTGMKLYSFIPHDPKPPRVH